MNALVVVMAHRGAKDCYDRHLRFWESHGCDMLVVGDESGRVQDRYEEINIGPCNMHCYPRWRAMLSRCAEAAETGIEMFMFYEQDSIGLDPEIPKTSGMFGVTQHQYNENDPTAERYANVPWRMDRETLLAIVEKMKAYPDFQEHGTNDRLIPGLAQLCSIPLIRFKPECYGAPGAKICSCHFPDLKRAIMKGATMIHGIKNREALDFVLECRHQYENERACR